VTDARVEIDTDDRETVIALVGEILIAQVERLRAGLDAVAGPGPAVIDLRRVERLDTAGAWMITDLRRRLEADGIRTRLAGVSRTQSELLETVEASLPKGPLPDRPRPGLRDRLADFGEATVAAGLTLVELTALLGAVMARIAALFLHPGRLRFTSLVHHMQEAGLNAVPIVSLMAFLIGVVLAFQGATQLQQFGAEIFVVDLIALSILRELGILLTAIIVAGRSASAFTAAIGSMKMREEVDAMRTLGLDPIEVLVLPRILALVIMLPILVFVADIMGLVGGALMSWIELGISPGMFQARLLNSTDAIHYVTGLIKAPFFAVLIGLIGCYEGLKVEGNAESLGRLTSKSVVLAIFLVIVADAAFSIFYALVGL